MSVIPNSPSRLPRRAEQSGARRACGPRMPSQQASACSQSGGRRVAGLPAPKQSRARPTAFLTWGRARAEQSQAQAGKAACCHSLVASAHLRAGSICNRAGMPSNSRVYGVKSQVRAPVPRSWDTAISPIHTLISQAVCRGPRRPNFTMPAQHMARPPQRCGAGRRAVVKAPQPRRPGVRLCDRT